LTSGPTFVTLDAEAHTFLRLPANAAEGQKRFPISGGWINGNSETRLHDPGGVGLPFAVYRRSRGNGIAHVQQSRV